MAPLISSLAPLWFPVAVVTNRHKLEQQKSILSLTLPASGSSRCPQAAGCITLPAALLCVCLEILSARLSQGYMWLCLGPTQGIQDKRLLSRALTLSHLSSYNVHRFQGTDTDIFFNRPHHLSVVLSHTFLLLLRYSPSDSHPSPCLLFPPPHIFDSLPSMVSSLHHIISTY